MPQPVLNVYEPTQVRNPWRAALRTGVQTGLVVIPVLGIVVPEIVRIILEELGRQNVEAPSWLRAVLLGIATGCTIMAAILARIMAIPQVNSALKRVRLDAGNGGKTAVQPLEPPYEGKHRDATA